MPIDQLQGGESARKVQLLVVPTPTFIPTLCKAKLLDIYTHSVNCESVNCQAQLKKASLAPLPQKILIIIISISNVIQTE